MPSVAGISCLHYIPEHCLDCDEGDTERFVVSKRSSISVFIQVCFKYRVVFLSIIDKELNKSVETQIRFPGVRECK